MKPSPSEAAAAVRETDRPSSLTADRSGVRAVEVNDDDLAGMIRSSGNGEVQPLGAAG
jgi:hypothetical protein